MPATQKHIEINFSRVADVGSQRLLEMGVQARIDSQSADGQVDVQKAWKLFIAAADAEHLGHLIPGTVGKTFAKQYGMVASKPAKVEQEKVAVPEAPLEPLFELKLTPAALHAIDQYSTTLVNVAVADGVLKTFNRAATVVMLKVMVDLASELSDSTTAQERAHHRQALAAVIKKVEALAA